MKTFTRFLLVTLQCAGSLFLKAQEEEDIAFSIKGQGLFCTTSKSYYVENLPKGATVKWKATPKGVVEITSPNSPQTTLAKVVDGRITLSATVTNFGDTAVLKKIVTVGNPFPRGTLHISANTVDNTYALQAGYTYFMASTSDYSKTTFTISDTRYSDLTWEPISLPPASSGIVWGGRGSVLQVNFGAPPTTSNSYSAVLKMHASGPCGLYTQNFSVTNILTSQSFTDFSLIPNPARQSSFVEVSSSNKIRLVRLIYAIRITDVAGLQQKMMEFKNGISSIKIPLTGLNTGVLLISIFDGKNWNTKQLVIQK